MDGLIVPLLEFKQYLGPDVVKTTGEKDDVLGGFILAAEEMVRGRCSNDFDRRAYTLEYHSGSDRPYLWARHLPVQPSPLPTVTENGASLVVAVGYDTTADVNFHPDSGIFTRMIGGQRDRWATGDNNVVLGYTAGYVLGTAPADLRLLIKFIAALTWQASDRNQVTVKRRSGQQGSTEFWDDLPPLYQAIINRYSVPILGE